MATKQGKSATGYALLAFPLLVIKNKGQIKTSY
jgi:hypothetical protein